MLFASISRISAALTSDSGMLCSQYELEGGAVVIVVVIAAVVLVVVVEGG